MSFTFLKGNGRLWRKSCVCWKIKLTFMDLFGLSQLGFKRKRSCNNWKILSEKSGIRNLVSVFKEYPILQRRQANDSYGWNLLPQHNKVTRLTDSEETRLKTPVSKGQWVIVVHAGGEQEFNRNALLMFKSVSNSGDYHSDMKLQ
jgi:hypothetical protein